MTRVTEGLARSVQTRLASHARAIGADPNLVLTRFATERLLYRLSVSPHAERFVLKGALLLLAWLGETLRPTRDADLLGFGDLSDAELDRIFRDLCALPVAPDGMTFASDSIRVSAIRLDDRYGGRRVTLRGELGKARLRVQVDVGIGDAVVPPAEWLEYPSLLGFARPRLRAYRRETVVAEKVHAMVVLGSKNSRLRDFFDVQALAQREAFDGSALTNALRAAFERRATPLPDGLPLALTQQFGRSKEKQSQWRGATPGRSWNGRRRTRALPGASARGGGRRFRLSSRVETRWSLVCPAQKRALVSRSSKAMRLSAGKQKGHWAGTIPRER